MAKHVWSVLCTKGALDTQTNQVSLLDVLEQASAVLPAPPKRGEGLHLPCQLVGLWVRSNREVPEQAQCAVHIEDASGVSTIQKIMDIDLSSTARFRSTFRMEGVPLQNGVIEFVVEYRDAEDKEWVEVARVPFELTVQIEAPKKRQAQKKPAG